MRKVLSISLPNEVVQYIKQTVKKRKFPSVSAYFRYIIHLDIDGMLPKQKYKHEK